MPLMLLSIPSAAQGSPVLLQCPQHSPVLLRMSPVLRGSPFSPLAVSLQAAMPVEPLICSDTATRVSSVLNRDVKHFGKKHMFDASEETCWNSDQSPWCHSCPQGACQWVTLDFPRSVRVSQLHIQFQGGFSSRLCTLEGCRAGEELERISTLYPEDSNAMQRFQLEETVLDKLKITFENSTDFFGRIVVYHLGVLGERL
ncbi:nuclear receptor 2C2-associated protein isoform 1-T1 [Amazona ochrocephala]